MLDIHETSDTTIHGPHEYKDTADSESEDYIVTQAADTEIRCQFYKFDLIFKSRIVTHTNDNVKGLTQNYLDEKNYLRHMF